MASVTNQFQNTKEKAKETASNIADKARDTAANVADKAGDVAKQAYDKAGQYASAVGDKADDAVESVGHGMKSFAGTIRENMPNKGMLGSASESVAGALESGGRYLEDRGLSGIGTDVTDLIKRNPVPAVLLALGLGFMIACATRR
jgi:sorbitol-specific phosphotransferase system component IIA